MSGREASTTIIPGKYALSVGDPAIRLPVGWSWARLTDIAALGTGHTPSRKHPEYWGDDVPWLGIRDAGAHHGRIINATTQNITYLGLANSSARLLPKGTVCLSRTASVGYVVKMGRDMATSQDFVTWSCGEALDPDYLMQALIAEGEDIRRFGEGSTHTTIYFPEVKAFHLALPPLPEQRRIVAKIDSLTGKSKRAREHLDHIPRLVEKYKQAVLAAAFRGDLTREWRTNNPGARWTREGLAALNKRRNEYLQSRRGSRLHTNIGREFVLPDGWFSAQLSDVGSLQVGYAYKSKWYAIEGVRLLRGANIAPGKVSWEDEVKLPNDLAVDYAEYRLNEGDIVIAMDRPVISTGLKAARICAEDAGCLLVQRVARYVTSELVDDGYVWHLINSQHFIDHAVTQATGSDLPHISSNDILTTMIPLPSPFEQAEIAHRVETIFSGIDRLAAEAMSARKLIERLDQAVLAKAFRGELVPRDLTDEPTSVLLERIRAERVIAPKAKRGRKAAN